MILVIAGAVLSAQTADDVISKYLDAIGGKKTIAKIKTLVVDGTLEFQGMEGATKTITISGKGVKMEIDMMGSMKDSGYLVRTTEDGNMGKLKGLLFHIS